MAQVPQKSLQEFEQQIAAVEGQIEKVKRLTREQADVPAETRASILKLEGEVQRLLRDRYSRLSGWDQVWLARNPKRPFFMDFIRLICTDFMELHGDRLVGEDPAIVGGVARFDGRWITVIGHQKGRDAAERHRRNHGYARPEGYRKALRLMRLSEKFERPIVCLVDTPGADCSVSSEEHGISEAIARNIHEMFRLRVPIVVAITGEGGSGGALGIGIGDRLVMLEHSIYSVIAPEGCAAIVWRDAKRGAEAAETLALTSEHALRFGVADEVVAEPLGGAHRDYDGAARALGDSLSRHLAELEGLSVEQLLERRYRRFRGLGALVEEEAGR
jgi:acetyl-CoA carboxylase carboxyl transferase subunit alpha